MAFERLTFDPERMGGHEAVHVIDIDLATAPVRHQPRRQRFPNPIRSRAALVARRTWRDVFDVTGPIRKA